MSDSTPAPRNSLEAMQGEISRRKGHTPPRRCSCAHYGDGSTNSSLCPLHANSDPCATMAQVTGKRRKGSIIRGTCTACTWTVPAPCTHDVEVGELAPGLVVSGAPAPCPRCGVEVTRW